jgi:hypothetical protein
MPMKQVFSKVVVCTSRPLYLIYYNFYMLIYMSIWMKYFAIICPCIQYLRLPSSFVIKSYATRAHKTKKINRHSSAAFPITYCPIAEFGVF